MKVKLKDLFCIDLSCLMELKTTCELDISQAYVKNGFNFLMPNLIIVFNLILIRLVEKPQLYPHEIRVNHLLLKIELI